MVGLAIYLLIAMACYVKFKPMVAEQFPEDFNGDSRGIAEIALCCICVAWVILLLGLIILKIKE